MILLEKDHSEQDGILLVRLRSGFLLLASVQCTSKTLSGDGNQS